MIDNKNITYSQLYRLIDDSKDDELEAVIKKLEDLFEDKNTFIKPSPTPSPVQ